MHSRSRVFIVIYFIIQNVYIFCLLSYNVWIRYFYDCSNVDPSNAFFSKHVYKNYLNILIELWSNPGLV